MPHSLKKKSFKSIIATVEVCGHQGLSLHGHKDDSKYFDDAINNPGNFQTLIKFQSVMLITVS